MSSTKTGYHLVFVNLQVFHDGSVSLECRVEWSEACERFRDLLFETDPVVHFGWWMCPLGRFPGAQMPRRRQRTYVGLERFSAELSASFQKVEVPAARLAGSVAVTNVVFLGDSRSLRALDCARARAHTHTHTHGFSYIFSFYPSFCWCCCLFLWWNKEQLAGQSLSHGRVFFEGCFLYTIRSPLSCFRLSGYWMNWERKRKLMLYTQVLVVVWLYVGFIEFYCIVFLCADW